MSFLGRKREVAALENALAAERALHPVYAGAAWKERAARPFMEKRKGLYFVGKRAPLEAQLGEFLEAAGAALGDSLVARARVSGWRDALSLVLSR